MKPHSTWAIALLALVGLAYQSPSLARVQLLQAREGRPFDVDDDSLAVILHIAASEQIVDPNGQPQIRRHELWLDQTTQAARYTAVNDDMTNRITHIRRGRALTRIDHDASRMVTTVAASDAAAYLTVAPPFMSHVDALARRSLPGDRQIGMMPESVTYDRIESITRSEMPGNWFDPPLVEQMAGQLTEARATYFTLEQARAFGAFDTFYVGDSFDGLPIFGIVHREGHGPGYTRTAGGPPMELFDVTYAERFNQADRRTDKLTIVQMPAVDGCPQREQPGGAPLPPAEVIQIETTRTELYTHGRNPRVDLQFRRGNTCIVIYGPDRDRAIEAARRLRPLSVPER